MCRTENDRNTHFEVLWVNDGSTDHTQALLEQIKRVETGSTIAHMVIEFSRNYGHEAAMIAGIDHASGEAVICMDADGQHPPAKIREMLRAFREGHEIILLERDSRADGGWLRRRLSGHFYHLMNRMSTVKLKSNSTDFFLISNQVAQILREHFRESNRFIRGYVQSVGFTTTVLSFTHPSESLGKPITLSAACSG
jgi:polyisoprenyl-phosphate glycosyltransferase